MNKRQRIVAMLRSEYERAVTEFRRAHAERIGIDAAANAWDQFHPHDGVGGFNPHNTIAATEREARAEIYANQMREAYEFAVDTFVEEAERNHS